MDNIKKIQEMMADLGIDAYIVPKNNEFFTSNLQDFEDRLKFTCGFDGSAGTLVVLPNDFLFFTDSRYEIQAKHQLKKNPILNISIPKWLRQNMPKTQKIGYDGFLHTAFEIKKFFGFEMVDVGNLIDKIWLRDCNKKYKIFDYDLKYCGETTESKLTKLKEKIPDVDCYIISDVDEISWLLNKRSDAFKYLPSVKGFMLFYPKDLTYDLFDTKEEFYKKIISNEDFYYGCDERKIHARVYNSLKNVVLIENEIQNLMSIKNKIEIENVLKVHEIEGLAICNFLAKINKIDEISELDASKLLDDCRKLGENYVDKSFETILASDENGAIVHYHPTLNTNKKIESLFLLDCGSQYLGGTTDMTRTVLFKGNVSDELKNDYTLVLKGHLALLNAIFPNDTKASVLDGLARQYLWQIGYDYGHGTGHGVGNFLNVHEGKIRISKFSDTVFKEGHLISCEPGIYKENKYGIRIENLMLVEKHNYEFLKFKNITFAPYDLRLINKEMLSKSEIDYINSYHEEIYNMYIEKIDDKDWLTLTTTKI